MQRTYELQSERSMPLGSLADTGPADIITAINYDPAAAQVDTVTIANYADGKVYPWSIDGVSRSYTATAADANNAGVAASVEDQLNSDPLFSGLYRAVAVAAVVTITARVAGQGWTLVGGLDFTVAHPTANDEADPIPFGRLVLADGQISGAPERKAKLATAANLTAQVDTLTPAVVNDTIYHVDITVGGATYHAETLSDGTATLKEIVEAFEPILNGFLPAASVIVTEDDTKLILTSELAGLGFSVSFGSSAATATWAHTSTKGEATDVADSMMGVAVRDDSLEISSTTEPGYAALHAMAVLRAGRIRVRTEAEITASNPVFVRLADTGATGEPLGAFRGSAATDCVELPRDKARWVRSLTAAQAVLQITAN